MAALAEYRERYSKGAQPRQMLCSDFRISIDQPEKAFVQEWNLPTARKPVIRRRFSETADTADDVLTRYRVKEILLLLDEVGKIPEFNYLMMLKTIDRVEVTRTGKLTFLFQSGVQVMV